MSASRICVGVVEISGLASGLVSGFRELGRDADLVLGYKHPFSYETFGNVSWVVRLWAKIGGYGTGADLGFLLNIARLILHRLVGWAVFFRCLPVYDVFIFTYGQGFTGGRLELLILKAFRKKVIYIYVGSDARPPYLDGGIVPLDVEMNAVRRIVRLARKKRRILGFQEKHADYVVNSPSSAQFHSRKFINWFSMGVPVAFSELNTSPLNQGRKVCRILHSPSNPVAKGTKFIQEAVDNLLEKGYEIELIQASGLPNAVVRELIASCDFVVDQVYSDSPMAVFAAEAASFSKAAVVAGYYAKDLCDLLLPEDVPPSLYVMPDELEAAIEKMISDRKFRDNLAKDAKDFVVRRWSRIEVARRYACLISGGAPESWYLSPSSLSYVGGWGISVDRISSIVSQIIKNYGVSALCLEHQPVLKEKLLQLTGRDSGGEDA